MAAFHRSHDIEPRFGWTTNRHNQLYCRWCFSDPAIADAFRERFGGACVTIKPQTSARDCLVALDGLPYPWHLHRPSGRTQMIRSELIERISAQNPHLYQRDVENALKAILGKIVSAMARGDRVELRGFGAFSVKTRSARTGRNPRTGTVVSVSEKSVPYFKTGKEMRKRLNSPSVSAQSKVAVTQ